MTDFQSLPGKTQRYLTRLSAAVGGVVPEKTRAWKFNTGMLADDEAVAALLTEVQAWAGSGGLYLYTFSLASAAADQQGISREFATAKARDKDSRAYARLNNPSPTIYAGSSAKIQQRLKEHLGYGAKKTYSLQLAAWSPPLAIELDFQCARYAADTAADVLQALEDTLWAGLLPMFGRQGAR